MAASAKYKSVDEYISNQHADAQVLLQDLYAAILKAAPKAKELFSYGVPAFLLVEGGTNDEQILIAAFKHHVGIYPHPTTIKYFKTELKEYKQGKGSIQFPFNTSIPAKLITKMVIYRKSLIEEENKKQGNVK